ncbi:MAG: hypothetical protein HY207_13850 [Nitrospirae bacterium]|nr:hypothetical protein [Nitrospirota bacterium]
MSTLPSGGGRAPGWLRWLKTGHVFWRIARPKAPSPLRGLAQAVAIENREVPAAGARVRVVVYRPRRPYATVVVNGGFVEESTDDPRLKNFATALAEVGFLALTPDYPAVRSLTFTPETIDQVHDVIAAVGRDPELGAGRPLAVIGLSYMATLSLKAALRPDLDVPPAYLGIFGGYEDFALLMRDVFQEAYRWDDTDVPVDPYGRFLVLRSVVEYFDPPPADRDLICELALRCGRCEASEVIEAAAGRLSPQGRAAFDRLRTFHPDRSPELWQTILRDARERCEALSVRESADRLRSRLILLHSCYDHVLPYTHSVRLHQRFPASELVLTTMFTHVNLRLSPRAVLSQMRELGKVSGVFSRLMALQE